MKKFRQRILEMKEGFLDGKSASIRSALILTNAIVIGLITQIIIVIEYIYTSDLGYIFYIIATITLLCFVLFSFNFKTFSMILPFSSKIMYYFFCRYGRVVTKKDWRKIKKQCPKVLYKRFFSKKSCGKCYFYSRLVAVYLEEAELMYCSIKLDDGSKTAHAVIVKNNCVYDTNARQHFDLEEYKKDFEVEVYKIFSKKEYLSTTFFDDIREDFVKWCAEKNVYCDPQ